MEAGTNGNIAQRVEQRTENPWWVVRCHLFPHKRIYDMDEKEKNDFVNQQFALARDAIRIPGMNVSIWNMPEGIVSFSYSLEDKNGKYHWINVMSPWPDSTVDVLALISENLHS